LIGLPAIATVEKAAVSATAEKIENIFAEKFTFVPPWSLIDHF
jgi:hypothetical protein